MEKERSLAEAWHHLRAALDVLDGGGADSKALVHIQWAIDLVDDELKMLNAGISVAQ